MRMKKKLPPARKNLGWKESGKKLDELFSSNIVYNTVLFIFIQKLTYVIILAL